MRRLLVSLLVLLSTAAPGAVAGTSHAGRIDDYRYRWIVPAGIGTGERVPLVVVLHGCDEDAAAIERGTRFSALAEQARFVVVYPETHASLDNPQGCWRWWDVAEQRRGTGEPATIVAIVHAVAAAAPVDRGRVYAVGMSAGGALAAILGALYPDVFAAIGVHSGLPFGAASTWTCAAQALAGGGPDAAALGADAYGLQGAIHRPVPLVIVQGLADPVVLPANATRLVREYAAIADLADDGEANASFDDRPDAEHRATAPGGDHYRRLSYRDASGADLIEQIEVEGLGHAWSGGDPQAPYTDPHGPDATRLIWSFLKRWSIASPAAVTRAPGACEETRATTWAHWLGGRLNAAQYWCDPWDYTWRHRYAGAAWSAGRCG